MRSTRREKREAIPCTDPNGNHAVVNRYVTVVTHSPINGPTQKADGSEDFITSDGQHVNANDDGTFTVVQTDQVLTPIK